MTRPYLGNPKYTIEVLQKYGFVFQKRFGQNFLIDTRVLDRIIEASEITKDDFVLEIGPGIGTMTQYLADAAREVTAVEIDDALIPILQDTLKEWDNVSVIHGDILKTDIRNPQSGRSALPLHSSPEIHPLPQNGHSFRRKNSNLVEPA